MLLQSQQIASEVKHGDVAKAMPHSHGCGNATAGADGRRRVAGSRTGTVSKVQYVYQVQATAAWTGGGTPYRHGVLPLAR